MLYITYWEFNENMPVEQRLKIGQKLTSSKMFPPETINLIRWDLTADGWGILIAEAESSSDISQALNMWRAAGTGLFRVTKTAPATSVQQAMSDTADLLNSLDTA